MKKTPIFITLLCIVNGFLIAQTNVKIMDIVVTPILKIDTITGQPINTNGEELNIMFKIKNVADADKVHVLFGTAQDLGDVLTIQAEVLENSGIYYISFNGIQKAVNGYTAQTEAVLTTQQLANYANITLYVEDNSGQESSRLYFVK
ncbi:MAG: hypothetical protein ABIJ97_09635 [Bacteroidota bacterium]